MIPVFTDLTEDFKRCVINPGLPFMDSESHSALKTTINSMNIKYQLVPPSNHIANNTEREIQTFKKHFIAGLCRVDKSFYLLWWDRL